MNENKDILLRKTLKYGLLISTVFNLISCQPPIYQKTADSSIQIDKNYLENEEAILMINPYKEKLEAEMNEVLVISAEEFPKERGKAETKIGNLIADLSYDIASKTYNTSTNHTIDFCLLNIGGLRTSLPKGEITRGKIFELMPFENELVVVTIKGNKYNQIVNYITSTPQPISGQLNIKEIPNPEKKSIKINEKYFNINLSFNKNGEIKILTSDYLANGGDNMKFFLDPIKIESLGIKLRDAIIQHCMEEHKKGNQLTGKLDGRITFE